jgi:type IV secretion system protein VirD4
MRVQLQRTDVLPLTWEIPAAIGLSWLLAAAVALPVGQGLAYVLTGESFAWPSGRLVQSLGGLVSGIPGRGLRPTSDQPSRFLVYVLAASVEAAVAGFALWVTAWWWRTAGPGAHYGLASRPEVRAVQGRALLGRRVRAIRPDLHGSTRPVWSRRVAKAYRPQDVGWRLGCSRIPRGVDLWVPFDRTAGVYGPQGSGKTLDLLTPALLNAPGAALVTLTKPDDLFLTLDHRAAGDRPVAVLDPFDLTPGVPELVWDPVRGCADSMVAERRAKAFTAGTVKGAVNRGSGDEAARFYAAEGAKVLQAYFHAAALDGGSLEDVLGWLADPSNAGQPEEVLRTHPGAAPFWDGLLRGALHGDDRTAGNTITTVQQSMALFFQASIRRRCTPGPARRATDLTDLISRAGTVYLLGREDPYASASPLMTAVAEHVLDTALALATASPYGRLCPCFLACLDELPSTTPLPTLRTRMANERALGLSFIYAAQTWRQLVICYGDDEARAMFGLTNNIVVFGGGKDIKFYSELSELSGTTRVPRRNYTQHPGGWGSSVHGEDVPILRPEELRQLPERHALVVAENARPFIARLSRCTDGRAGRALLNAQAAARSRCAPPKSAVAG